MTERLNATLRIEKASEGVAKVVWMDSTGARFEPYHLYVDHVRIPAAEARSALTDMYNEYLRLRPDFSCSIRTLADKGKRLRESLFFDGPPEDRSKAAAVLHWFDNLTNQRDYEIEMTIHVDPILQIPWGLLHDVGPSSLSIEQIYQGFWSLRYSVAAIYNGMLPALLKEARRWDKVRLLSAYDEEVFTSAVQSIDLADHSLMRSIIDLPVGPALTLEGVKRRWKEVGENNCILNFFGHAAGTEIRLRHNEHLSARGFREVFRRDNVTAGTSNDTYFILTFLNGCSTGAGAGADSFLVATADPGFCGFVGVEARVPDVFALLFGQEFLHSMLVQGASVREAMRGLWRKHKPMAIFYGCYAHPDFRVELGPSMPVPEGFEDRNLSTARTVLDSR